MNKSSFRELDYAFGQRMLKLRMALGLTQARLAEILGVSRHAVGAWEVGQTYPKADHLKHIITLCIQQHAFAARREAEEIRGLWRAAHQKVLLDEAWLHALLSGNASPLAPMPVVPIVDSDHVSASPTRGPQVDWGDALDVPTFYGREKEISLLTQWVVEERCRVVSVLGMGGIGKSALTVTVMHSVAPHFDAVIWRSLRDAPNCEALVDSCLQVLAPHVLSSVSDSLDVRLQFLMKQLRDRRVLLVLDNLEVLLEEGTEVGRIRAGFQGYSWLLQRISETAHQSCLMLTSREKLAHLAPLEGSRAPVRAIRLDGLDVSAAAQLLVEKDVAGTIDEQVRLIELYQGNPLVIKIVAQAIVELFDGAIMPFLAQGSLVFGGVRELLDQHFARLSPLEQTLFFWLAILREPVNLKEFLIVLSTRQVTSPVIEALDALGRRNLIERGSIAGSFTLQSVVLEYATAQLIEETSHEIEQGRLDRLIAYGLCLAHAKEYVRKTQEQLLVIPLLARLQRSYTHTGDLQARLYWLLDQIRGWDQQAQGYGPANLLALLQHLRGDLRGLNLSRLALRDVSLQDVGMQDVQLTEAVIQGSIFTEATDAIGALAISRAGEYWAAATWRGEVRLWGAAGQTLHLVWQAHGVHVSGLAFSPDERSLATVSWDNTVKLWDVTSGTLQWAVPQTGGIICVAFSPDGQLLASGGGDTHIYVRDARSGTQVQLLTGQTDVVHSLAWSPDGSILACGCADGTIWLWMRHEPDGWSLSQKLTGRVGWVSGLAFAPCGTRLASASFDTIKVWDTTLGDCLQTMSEHSDRVLRVAWSPDGHTLASSSFDHTIWLWDVAEERPRAVLRGHTGIIYGLVFVPDSRALVSGSDDGTIRVWDVDRGYLLRSIGGHVGTLFDVSWSPDGTRLASCGADTSVAIWKKDCSTPPRVLRGHRWFVQGAAWSPDGRVLASSGYDNNVSLWDTATGVRLHQLHDPDVPSTMFLGVAWSPDGRFLACGSYHRGVYVWDTITQTRRMLYSPDPALLRRVAWSPDGAQLASGGDNGYVYVWNATETTLLLSLSGHGSGATSVAWSPNGTWLASGGGNATGSGELFVWDARTGERVQTMGGHSGIVYAMAWSSNSELLISGSTDGTLHWWDVRTGRCQRVHAAHRGTVQALAVSFDGRVLASCGDDGAILLWDVYAGTQLQTLRQDRPYERMDITGLTGVTPAQRDSLIALGAVDRLQGERKVVPAHMLPLPVESFQVHDLKHATRD